MAAAHPKSYVLFDPRKRQSNKALALRIVAHYFQGQILDDSTVRLPGYGDVHVAAYTDTSGAMVRNATDPVDFGGDAWHAKGRIAMVREIPEKGRAEARCAIYICRIKDLFDHIGIGNAGVPWESVRHALEEKLKIFSSARVAQDLNI